MKKVKKKLSIKKTLRNISVLLLVIIFITIIINRKSIYIKYLSSKTGYNIDIIELLLDKDIDIDKVKNNYSTTLANIYNSEYFNSKYINEYIDITYHENLNFYNNINLLLDLGYSSSDINNIYDKLNNDNIELIINNSYLAEINNIINLSYFKEEYLKRYLDYLKDDISYETAITYVNIGLDNEYYTNVSDIIDADNLLVLVNKYNKLSDTYVPSDLKTIDAKYQWYGRSNMLRKDAKNAFEKMCQDALEENIYLYAGSGYRSYNTQLYLYNTYVSRDGKTLADTYSARAGYSEHQTGLAMDIANKNNFISESDKEYTWLINNSYKYGFILRYPKDKDNITGYMYEEWHYRYVGVDVAKEIYDLNITYDEYIARNLDKN